MNPRLDASPTLALLLDIEGTTTPVEFVYQVLFPYARKHLQEYLEREENGAEVQADLDRLRQEHTRDTRHHQDPPRWRQDSTEARLGPAIEYAHWLMDRDRKSTALKSLQGKIWEVGYRSGELRGEVYPDVAPAFARWTHEQRKIAIFSSGSALAQKLLFANSTVGDLTLFISAYFDTTTGGKTETESYRRIAAALGPAPREILFISDVVAELEAARQAGMATALCLRSKAPQPDAGPHNVIHTFEEI